MGYNGRGKGRGDATATGEGTAALSRQTRFSASLGEWCLRHRYVTSAQIDECLRAQREAAEAGRPVPRLGELLVQRGLIRPEQIGRALAEQNQKILNCPRCAIRVNVSIRPDAAGYRCGRCQGPLVEPPPSAPVDVVEDEIIVDSRDPVPPEVRSAMKDSSRRLGKYVLVRELGRGGVGVVYLAWDSYLSQFIALKRIHPAPADEPRGLHEVRIQSLIQEARSAIRLRHPGIVTVYDAGRIGGDWFISMEYLEGETLEDRIRASRAKGKASPFFESPRPALRLLADVARAVGYAHTRPNVLVHCDLKPANILIDREERPHVLDFGLARRLRREASGEPQVAGTPSYMAPEQARGQMSEIDARTDVYALGAVLYEMLVGHPPFVGEPLEVMGRTMEEEPQTPTRVLQKERETKGIHPMTTRRLLRIPPALEDLCMRCLRKEKARRPGTMADVADLLERMLQKKSRR